MIDIKALSDLEKSATQRPWEIRSRNSCRALHAFIRGKWRRIANAIHPPGMYVSEIENNAALIAALRNAAPALLRLVRADMAIGATPPSDELSGAKMHERAEALEAFRRLKVNGACCSCGYDGEEETPCGAREDETHCEHWWDGPDALPTKPVDMTIGGDE